MHNLSLRNRKPGGSVSGEWIVFFMSREISSFFPDIQKSMCSALVTPFVAPFVAPLVSASFFVIDLVFLGDGVAISFEGELTPPFLLFFGAFLPSSSSSRFFLRASSISFFLALILISIWISAAQIQNTLTSLH